MFKPEVPVMKVEGIFTDHSIPLNTLVPSKPQRLTATVITSSSFTINWDPPTVRDNLRGYNIYGLPGVSLRFRSSPPYTALGNLQPATQYIIEVAATTSNSLEGERSEVVVSTLPLGSIKTWYRL